MADSAPTPEESGGDGKRDELLRILRSDLDAEQAYGVTIASTMRIDPDEMRRVIAQALGDREPFCPECEEMCVHRETEFRDAFIFRALALVHQWTPILELYTALRSQGIVPSEDHLERIYRLWFDLSYLHEAAEPQAGFDDRNEFEDED